jgi:hypothetical protein
MSGARSAPVAPQQPVARVAPALVAALVAVAAALAVLPQPAAANDVGLTSWGAIAFSQSDRDVQASGSAHGLAVDPTGRIVAALGDDGAYTYAYRFNSDGVQVARFRVGGRAAAIAVDQAGRVFTATPGGGIAVWARTGRREGAFATGAPIAGLATDGNGHLYAAGGKEVRVYSEGGALGARIGGPDTIGSAAAVAVDRSDHVFVADSGRQHVAEFTPAGALMRTIGGPDPAAGGLRRPVGVGVDGDGHVVVADPGDESGPTQVPPPYVKRFADDGAYQGPIDNGAEVDFSSLGSPLLLAVAPQGDVYFSDNPDFFAVPASVVEAPRFLFDDGNVIGGGEFDAAPVSVGRTVKVPTRVYPSLSSNLRASVDLGRGLELADGAPSDVAADVPAGKPALDLTWPVRATTPGHKVVAVTVTGTGPDGRPAKLTKAFDIYAIDGPRLKLLNAVFLPKSRVIYVAAILTFGSVKIPSDSAALEDLGFANLDATVRSGKRKLPGLDFSIGEAAGGTCLPFAVPRGVKGTAKLRVHASFAGIPGVNGASATRTIRPRRRVARKSLLASCLESASFGGGPSSKVAAARSR